MPLSADDCLDILCVSTDEKDVPALIERWGHDDDVTFDSALQGSVVHLPAPSAARMRRQP